jgi:MFS family permease
MESMAPARHSYDIEEQKREQKYGKSYKWIALSNTTLGALMASINASILIISLPAIFKGLNVNPIAPSSTVLLLWLLLGYSIVSAVAVVSVGRLSDMYGRVRLYNLGFAVFTIGSIGLYASSLYVSGTVGALSLIFIRILQGLGGAFLFANSAAILTDVFPSNERGKALGFNQIAAVGGSVLGFIIGGLLAGIDWHLVFLINVPFGIIGTVWAYVALHEIASIKKNQKFDIFGNATFAIALILLLVGITYGLLPYGSSTTGWSNPFVSSSIIVSIILFVLFVLIELRTREPMMKLSLFRIRAFTFGNLSLALAGLSRGGLQFMLIIWLQGIWLPLHGVSFSNTPFDAAIDLIPFAVGFLISGPLFGYLSDKRGARLFTTSGMLINVAAFLLLLTLPADFDFISFALITVFFGIGQGMFSAPNTAAIMNAVPPDTRGAVSGIRSTFLNTSFMLSLVLFFTILIATFGHELPPAIASSLNSLNVSQNVTASISDIPPTGILFSALLGYNPIKNVIPPQDVPILGAKVYSELISKQFFPKLISKPFIDSMRVVFYIGAIMAFIAALLSALRGKRYVYDGVSEKARSGRDKNSKKSRSKKAVAPIQQKRRNSKQSKA